MGGKIARSEKQSTTTGAARALMQCCEALCIAFGVPHGPLRVYPGGLAVTRSMGDVEMKASRLISAEPEIKLVCIHHVAHEMEQFLILI